MFNHEIVILGANFAGVQVAHYLLKHTIPALESRSGKLSYHVTIIAPNRKTYYKIGAPRAIAAPNKISTEQIFLSIENQFAYSKQISFVYGWATEIKPSRFVNVNLVNGGSTSIAYDSLIIATGSKFHSPLWNFTAQHTTTQAVIQNLQKRLPFAKSVFVGGGGAVGIETSSEIAENHPQARVSLLSGTTRVLPRLTERTSRKAEKKLRGLGINIIHNLKVIDSQFLADGRTRLFFDNKTQQIVDIYIDATGGKPNTSFLPKSWLDIYGFVSVDDSLRGNKVGMDRVYAIGDCASYSSCTNMDVYYGIAPLASSIGVDLTSRTKHHPKTLRQKQFKGMKDTLVVSIGRKGGVMQVIGWSMPSFVVWAIKSRSFTIDGAMKTVTGENFLKP